MGAAVLHTCVCKLSGVSFWFDEFVETRFRGVTHIQGAQLGIWVLVVDALLERAHRLLRLDCLGSDYVGYL